MTDAIGFATSHGPMLSTEPRDWEKRAAVDRRNAELVYDGTLVHYDDLLQARGGAFAGRSTAEEMEQRHQRSQDAIARMARAWREADVDRAIIVGNDHKEAFSDECFGALTVFAGPGIMQVPFTDESVRLMPEGTEGARDGHTPRATVSHPGDPVFADELIGRLTDADFDVARSTVLPLGKYQNRSIPHAFGFVYRRVMSDRVPPHVPIFVNTFYPPNLPSPVRCIAFGRELGRAVRGSDAPGRTAIVASGGLSHFVIEEELDELVLEALRTDDLDALAAIDADRLRSGTAEIRTWIVLAGAMHELGLRMELIDYVPCYRTEAGTGSGMGFAVWR